ncbi:MAG: hypothetical protein BWZ10_02521 [candidate division BRC1 bacterium ADurb.BinA364]|nr:MAG: hypothetical protein BWZ10_02521 [candidate division BRC1 bacterium ADurb.BinA364]
MDWAGAVSAAAFAAPYLLLAGWGVRRMALAGAAARRRVALACAAAWLGCAVWAAAVHANPWSGPGLFYHKDDASYDRWGREIAERWKQGERPALSRDSEIGTLHTGYYRFVAALYWLAGPSPRLAIALNMLACALLPAALYFLALDYAGPRAAAAACWMAALYPSFWHHSVFLMRDAWITLFFVAAAGVSLDIRARRESSRALEAGRWICLAGLCAQVFLLRYYLVVVLAAAWALYGLALVERKRRALALATLVALAAAALAARWTVPSIAHWQDRLVQSFLWAIPRDQHSLAAVARRFAAGAAKLFLAPLPWAASGGYSIDYFLWPGQWMLYLGGLPLGLWGLWSAARRGPPIGFVLMLPFFAAAYGFSVAYEGSVPRQRMFLDALLIVFAARAWAERAEGGAAPRGYFVAYYSLLGLFVAAHIASLFVRGIW